MEKNCFVNQIKFKDNVESIFLVKYIALMEGKDKKNYLNFILTDKTGDLEARKWHAGEELFLKIKKGDYVFVKGKANSYQGKLQFVIDEITTVDLSLVTPKDYVVESLFAPEKMYEELLSVCEQIEDIYLKNLVTAIYYDSEIKKELLTRPAAKTIHHAFVGGLLEHTLSCAKIASFVCSLYPVNKSFVLAGILLHDLSKIYELSDSQVTDYTDEGKLLGHSIKMVEVIDHFAKKIPDFPFITKTHLKHIIISHHGLHEHGAAKVPHTTEAMLVHLIDLMDSQIASFETAKKDDKLHGNWTAHIRHLDRMLYKKELPTFLDTKIKQDDKSHVGSLGKLLKDFKV